MNGAAKPLDCLDADPEPKLRQLGERADTYRMMQRAFKEAGIEEAGSSPSSSADGGRRR